MKALIVSISFLLASQVAFAQSLDAYSIDEIKSMSGLAVDEGPEVQFILEAESRPGLLPSKLDWRNRGGINWVTPVMNQLQCGSCVAFASIATLETQYRIDSGLATTNVRLSPQHLFSCGGGSCWIGWTAESAARFLQSRGVPDEGCSPYTSGTSGSAGSCSASCADHEKRSVRVSSYTKPTAGARDLDAIKKALQRGPLVTMMSLYSDFRSYSGGIFKRSGGRYLSGHAVSIVGYDDASRYLVIRNSWGEGWGEKGFARVSYDDTSGIGDATWSYSVAMRPILLESPKEGAYHSTNLPVRATLKEKNLTKVKARIYDSAGTEVINQAPGTLDIRSLKDGKYDIEVTGTNASGKKVRSLRTSFFIANRAPRLDLAFESFGAQQSTDAMSGRVEFDIATWSSTVPMNEVEFHWRDQSGAEKSKKAIVRPGQLKVAWNTDLIPNGTYDIWMVGRVKTDAFEKTIETAPKKVQVAN